MINEGFYLTFQAFEVAKVQEFEEAKEELASHLLILDLLECLQKCTYLCKDNQESKEEEDNKYFKMKNLISCLKGKNEELTVEDLSVDSDEILEDLLTKTNDLHKQASAAVNEIRIKLKEEELLGNKTKKVKLTEAQQKDLLVVKSLLEVASLEEMKQLVSQEIEKFDNDLQEDEKKNLFLEKYGRKVSRTINFYYLLSVIYDTHDQGTLENLKELLSLMPNFYLPLYFSITKTFFPNSCVPPAFARSFIRPYKSDREGRLLHDLLKDYIDTKIMPEALFLFFSETVRHLCDTNIFQLPTLLTNLSVPAFDQGLVFLSLLIKKILLSIKYIDVYPTGDEFLQKAFALLPLSIFKSQISSSTSSQEILKDFLAGLVQTCESLEEINQEEMVKVEQIQAKLAEQLD